MGRDYEVLMLVLGGVGEGDGQEEGVESGKWVEGSEGVVELCYFKFRKEILGF